jgi:hypothetical protein
LFVTFLAVLFVTFLAVLFVTFLAVLFVTFLAVFFAGDVRAVAVRLLAGFFFAGVAAGWLTALVLLFCVVTVVADGCAACCVIPLAPGVDAPG